MKMKKSNGIKQKSKKKANDLYPYKNRLFVFSNENAETNKLRGAFMSGVAYAIKHLKK